MNHSLNTGELFISLDETWSELIKMIYTTNNSLINVIPFKDSWTVAQLATHITKSNNAIAQGLKMDGKRAERNPEEGVPHLKKIFLDFTTKFQSPEFIVPEAKNYDKEEVIAELKKSEDRLKHARIKVALDEIIDLPVFGEVTKLELLHFVLYHTQRHIHQLKGINNALKKIVLMNH
jgi:DinB superfamily